MVILQVPFLVLHLREMQKHTALAIVGVVSVACQVASAMFGNELFDIIYDLSLVQTMYMVHMRTDEDKQAALVLKLTVGLCVVLDSGLKLGQYASLLYAVYLSFIIQEAIVYHLVYLGLLCLFTSLDLDVLREICKFCLLLSVYDMAEAALPAKECIADAA